MMISIIVVRDSPSENHPEIKLHDIEHMNDFTIIVYWRRRRIGRK